MLATSPIGTFAFAPLCGIIRIPLLLGSFKPYLLGRIGYGLFLGDLFYKGTYGELSGGIYYAFGGGIEIIFAGNFIIFAEATYSVNHGSVVDYYYGYSANIIFSRMDIFVGAGVGNYPFGTGTES